MTDGRTDGLTTLVDKSLSRLKFVFEKNRKRPPRPPSKQKDKVMFFKNYYCKDVNGGRGGYMAVPRLLWAF